MLTVVFLCLLSCSKNSEPTAGGSTEVGNTISVKLVNENGELPESIQVEILSPDYDPVKDSSKNKIIPEIDYDSDGNYVFRGLTAGLYNVVIMDPNLKTKSLIKDVVVKGTEISELGLDTLKPTGVIEIASGEIPHGSNGYIYIEGTDIFEVVDTSKGSLILEEVPVQTILDIKYSHYGGLINDILISDTLSAIPGDTLLIGVLEIDTLQPNPNDTNVVDTTIDLTFVKGFSLNLSDSVINLNQNLYNFPLLLRIDSQNFNFSESKKDGSDLSIRKTTGELLPTSIELWDSVSQLGVLWVKIDTIFSNSISQSYKLYYGKNRPPDSSTKEFIFDETNSFAAVWHLGNEMRDVSSNTITGHNMGTQIVQGIIGSGREFNGKDSYIETSDINKLQFGESDDFTISLWIKTEQPYPDSVYEPRVQYDPALVANKQWLEDGDGVHAGYAFAIQNGKLWGNFADDSNRVDVISATNVNDSSWHYCVMVVDQKVDSLMIYIDGEIDVAKSIDSINNSISGKETVIGDGVSRQFVYKYHGLMDELRFSKTNRNIDWIKMEFANQKKNQELIQWK